MCAELIEGIKPFHHLDNCYKMVDSTQDDLRSEGRWGTKFAKKLGIEHVFKGFKNQKDSIGGVVPWAVWNVNLELIGVLTTWVLFGNEVLGVCAEWSGRIW